MTPCGSSATGIPSTEPATPQRNRKPRLTPVAGSHIRAGRPAVTTTYSPWLFHTRSTHPSGTTRIDRGHPAVPIHPASTTAATARDGVTSR